MHSASAPSFLSDVHGFFKYSSNEGAERIVPEYKNIENILNRWTSSSYGQMVTYFVSKAVNDGMIAFDIIEK